MNPRDFVQDWVEAGVPREKAAEMLLGFTLQQRPLPEEKRPQWTAPVLMAVSTEECAELRLSNFAMPRLKASPNPVIKALATVTDETLRRRALDEVCPNSARVRLSGQFGQ